MTTDNNDELREFADKVCSDILTELISGEKVEETVNKYKIIFDSLPMPTTMYTMDEDGEYIPTLMGVATDILKQGNLQ